MNSFTTNTNSVTFDTDSASWAEPASAAVEVKGFPGGDAIAVSLGGQRELTRTVTLVFSSVSAYRSLVAMRGRQGWLTIDNWDSGSVSAVLKQTSPQPPGSDGSVAAQAQFVLLSL